MRGYCKDDSNPELFEEVGVYGNIYNSNIHHLYFGVYSYGHQQGDWRNNKVHDNIGYGFDPHDDSDYVTIHDNKVYNNGNHGIIASKRCHGISVQVRVHFLATGSRPIRIVVIFIEKKKYFYNHPFSFLFFLKFCP